MALTIKERSLFIKKWMKVYDDGVICFESAFLGSKKRYPYGQIEYVLLSADGVLSVQAGDQIFSVKTKSQNARHQQAIAALLAGLKNYTAGFPVVMDTSRQYAPR